MEDSYRNKDIGMGYGTLWMGYGTLVSLVFHNLPSLYPSSFCRNDFLYLFHSFFHGASPMKIEVLSLLPTHHYICSLLEPSCGLLQV